MKIRHMHIRKYTGHKDRELLLMESAATGDIDTLRRLLDEGVDVDTHEWYSNGMTPVALAAANGNLAEVIELLKAGADVNIIDRCNETALTLAFKWGQVDIVKNLLQYYED